MSPKKQVPLDKRAGRETAVTVSGGVRSDVPVNSQEIIVVELGRKDPFNIKRKQTQGQERPARCSHMHRHGPRQKVTDGCGAEQKLYNAGGMAPSLGYGKNKIK